ncbi:MAG: hypothetical protein FJ290_21790 [Planctomycetes bacterium]|nr:hypothetical protein [Planctomycetota bacterium]
MAAAAAVAAAAAAAAAAARAAAEARHAAEAAGRAADAARGAAKAATEAAAAAGERNTFRRVRPPAFSWAGALKDLKGRYTSVQLQHEISRARRRAP